MVDRFKIMSTSIPPNATLGLVSEVSVAKCYKEKIGDEIIETWDDSRSFSGRSGLTKPWKDATVNAERQLAGGLSGRTGSKPIWLEQRILYGTFSQKLEYTLKMHFFERMNGMVGMED